MKPYPLLVLILALSCRSQPPAGVRVNTMIDPRDGQFYPTMGTAGKTWLARNLDLVTPDSWCYGDAKECAMYGRVYTRNAALKACPPGWRLPSDSDWIDLAKGFGGYYEFVSHDTVGDPRASYTALTTGTFAAKLGGSRDPSGKYMDLEGDGMYWTSSTCGVDSVSFIVFNERSKRVMRDCDRESGWAQSVRCLRDH
jgi:uncharacterized protein (TIGR02145 family)